MATKSMNKESFYIGSHYEYPFGGNSWRKEWRPKNVKDWGKDLDKIRETGFNIIRIRIGFDSNLDDTKVLLDLCRKKGIKVMYGFATFYLPAWFREKYPDSLAVNIAGGKVGETSTDTRWPQMCIRHPEYRSLNNKLISDSARRFGTHPAIVRWDIHNEPHVGGTDQYYCYCKNCITSFRSYIQKKYPVIEEFNKKFNTGYRSFDEIEPPREVNKDINSYWAFWREFSIESLSEFLNECVDIVHKTIPGMPVTSNMTLYEIHVKWCQDWWNTRNFDWPTMSIYNGSNENSLLEYHRLVLLKALNPGKPVWVTETTAGPFSSKIWTGKNIELETWAMIGYGIKGLIYYRWDPLVCENETMINAMIDIDTYDTERRLRTKKVIKQIQKHENMIMDSEISKPSIGIYLARRHVFHTGLQEIWQGTDVGGWFGLFSNLGYNVTFICDPVNESQQLPEVPVIVVPFPASLNREEWKTLNRFMENGGYVITGIPTQNKEYAESILQMSGMKLKEFDFRINSSDGWNILKNDGKSAGFVYHKRVIVENNIKDSTVIAKYCDNDAPAIVLQKNGKLMVSTFSTADSYVHHLRYEQRNFLGEWLAKNNIKPDIEVKGISDEYRPLLDVRTLEKGNKVLIIVINRSQYEWNLNIKVKGYKPVKVKSPIMEATQVLSGKL